MLSKTSFFNKTLFKKNMARFWPMWGMVTFVAALLPATMLLNLNYDTFDALQMTELYYYALARVIPIVSLVYAVLCAVACWEYLFFPRNLSLMHTLPIRREGIFATNFLSGMAMMLIPYAVTGVMCIVVSAIFGSFALLPLLKTILGVLGLSFFYFCSATFTAFLTGNIFMMPALYFLLHFLAPLMDFLCGTYANQFIYGLSANYSGKADFLSPTVYLMKTLDVENIWQEIPDPHTAGGVLSVVADYELTGIWAVGVYALVGAALLAAAWWLYSRRRSECAGDVMAVRHLKPVFRFGIAALAAVSGGLVLYMLLWDSFKNRTLIDPLPMVAFMIIAGAIGYYAASMMLAKSLRVFRGSWKGMALVAVFSAALCVSLSTDILGIGSRIPAAEDIQTLTFRAAGNSYTFEAESFASDSADAALLEEVLALHGAIAADRDYIVKMLDSGLSESVDYSTDALAAVSYRESVRFFYELKDGSSMERRYTLCLTPERMTRPETYDARLDTLINRREMRCKRLLMDRPEYEPYNGDIWLDFGSNTNFTLNDRETAMLLEAVRTDALEGTWGQYYWFSNEENYSARYAMSMDLNLRHYNAEGGWYEHENLNINIHPGMKHTIAALIALDIVESEADMKTYAQVEFDRFCKLMLEKEGRDPRTMTRDELEYYCEMYGFGFASCFRILYGYAPDNGSANTSKAVVTIPGGAVDRPAVNMNPNSSSVYVEVSPHAG